LAGTKAIKSISGADLTANDLVVGSVYIAIYAVNEFRLLAPTKNYIDQLAFNSAPSSASTRLATVEWARGRLHTNPYRLRAKETKGADIASAAAIDLTVATGNLVHITGTTQISAIAVPAGAEYTLVFDGAVTLVNSASLILPGAANLTSDSGTVAKVRGDTGGVARIVSWFKADGQAVSAPPSMKVSDQRASGTAGGTSVAATISNLHAQHSRVQHDPRRIIGGEYGDIASWHICCAGART
jgi:hypothetical protein